MIPYFIFTKNVNHALFISIAVTAVVLIAFGFIKSKFAGTGTKDACIGSLQTLILGGIAAGVAYGVVEAVNSSRAL
jgi:VIT1/CCC1 family predicted Fe2+/Mn2+ transporter